MNFYRNIFLFLLIIFFCIEISFGYWIYNNPFYFIKTIYKDYKFYKKNPFEGEDKLLVNNFNIYGMRYESNDISDLDGIFFGSGIVLQSKITEGKTFIDLIEKKKKLKLSNFGADGQS